MTPHEVGVVCERCLSDRGDTQGRRRVHEVGHVSPTVHRAVNTQQRIGGDQRRMRRAKELVVFQCLASGSFAVAVGDTNTVVKGQTTFAAPRFRHTLIDRMREIRLAGMSVRMCAKRFTKAMGSLTARDDHSPRLAVAPGRSALRYSQDGFDRFLRYRLWLERAAAVAPRKDSLETDYVGWNRSVTIADRQWRECRHWNVFFPGEGVSR